MPSEATNKTAGHKTGVRRKKVRGSKKARAKNGAGESETFDIPTDGTPTSLARASKRRGKPPEKKQKILALHAEHPDWTQAQIAEAAGCVANYVNSVLNPGKPRKGKQTKKQGSKFPSSVETDFYRILKRIGVARAKQLIANIEAFQGA